MPAAKLRQLLTIGYEAASIQDFLATLQALHVTTVLDVREIAASRRRGFAKTALRNHLEGIGIHYRHEPALGSPRDIRHRLRESGDYVRFFRDFNRYLTTQDALLKRTAQELSGTVALLCYERNHKECHRSSVAAAFGKLTGLSPGHQGVTPHGAVETRATARTYPRQGVPAA
jgi:uncharacterized protein (DUF488 family)